MHTDVLGSGKTLKQSIVKHSGDSETDYLRSVSLRVLSAGVDVKSRLEIWQQAAASIVAYSQEQRIDLIVMASHGRSGISRLWYGSVAEQVLRRTSCDLLVVCAQTQFEQFRCKRILIPLDGSPLAAKALAPGISLAIAMDSELLLLRVATQGKLALQTGDTFDLYSYIEAEERSEAEAYLRQLRSLLTKNCPVAKTDVVSGFAPDCILHYASEQQIDLIVMASHGRSGLPRWFYGSVAEKVLRGSRCATLVASRMHNSMINKHAKVF